MGIGQLEPPNCAGVGARSAKLNLKLPANYHLTYIQYGKHEAVLLHANYYFSFAELWRRNAYSFA